MATVNNPFFMSIQMPDEYFCDRAKETNEITRYIKNGKNVVLKAPRRIGKSSLIKHILEQNELKRHYNLMYVDIMGTSNADEFIRVFQNEILGQPFARTAKVKESIKNLLLHLSLEPSYDISTSTVLPKIGFNGVGNIEINIKNIFEILESTKKKNIVVFDEFQQIEFYPQNMSAILRTYIQQCNNTGFIFSGSEQHMLSTMFNEANRPFFNSATPVDLDIIPLQTYEGFCKDNFKKFNKKVTSEAIELIYYVFSGRTYYMQDAMNSMFDATEENQTADRNLALQTIKDAVRARDTDFRYKLNEFSGEKERRLLFCIANEGVASELLSGEMIRKYGLGTPSSVQNAINKLSNKQKRKDVNRHPQKEKTIKELAPGHYMIEDKYFELWLVEELPSFYFKIEHAKELFQREREIITGGQTRRTIL